MDGQEAPPMRFFDGFEWAVPTAFASALSSHRFEQGDVLFRDAAAYEPLTGSPPADGLAIQVLQPPRSARTSPAEIEGDRRRSSWQSEVEIELVDLARGTREGRTISQGKLMMALWRGDERWLDPVHEEPPLPRMARDLAQHLATSATAFDDAQSTTGSGCRFVFVVDLASDASRIKAQAIEEALVELGSVERIDLAPAAAGVESPESFHPALVIRALVVSGATLEAAQDALKAALYGGATGAGGSEPSFAESEAGDSSPGAGAEASSGGPGKTDRFSVARHGLLEPIGE